MTYYLNYDPTTDTLLCGNCVRSYIVRLFESYEEKGNQKNKPSVVVGESGFTFTIETNFGYGNASYLRFKAEYHGNVLYNFQNIHGEYAEAYPSAFFNVEPTPENWDKLFVLIAHVYKNKEYWNINECLKWQDARIANQSVYKPFFLVQSFNSYITILTKTGLANIAPIMEKTETIIVKELSMLSQILLNEDKDSGLYYNCKNAIINTFNLLTSIDKLDIFLKALQNRGPVDGNNTH